AEAALPKMKLPSMNPVHLGNRIKTPPHYRTNKCSHSFLDVLSPFGSRPLFVNLEVDPRVNGISETWPPSPAALFLSMKTTKHCLRVVNWRRGFHRNKRRRTLLLRIRTRRLERSRPLPSGIPKDAFRWTNRVRSADRRFFPQRRGRPRS